MTITDQEATWFANSFSAIAENVEKSILGHRSVVEQLLAAFISQGHVLIEDNPGTGKTSLAKALAQSFRGVNTRIQFTPDLLPSDVTGVTVYDQKRGEFEFHPGPIFANIVLVDEINRASPKTQSALLEVMEEGQVTIDGITRSAPKPFFVIATQNPVEQAGTYRLPEAQLDRFLIKTSLGYPDHAVLLNILAGTPIQSSKLLQVTSSDDILKMSALAKKVYAHPVILDYVARIVESTRSVKQLKLGVSIRGALALIKIAKTKALSEGRNFVIPDDVKNLVEPVLAHRVLLEAEAEFDGVRAESILQQIVLKTEAPLLPSQELSESN